MVVSALMAVAAARPAGVVNPDWVRKPSSEEVLEHYPKLMSALGVEGKAVIRCRRGHGPGAQVPTQDRGWPAGRHRHGQYSDQLHDGDRPRRRPGLAASRAPVVLEQSATVCAELFTPQQMEQIVAFLESDSGQALLNNLSTVSAQVNQAMKSQVATIAAAARKIWR